jgi:DNA-binding NarL/FixJ family response regulator
VKILLVDDHKIVRDGLRAVLAREPGMKVVGEAADGREAIALTRRLRPTVVVMDVSMPDLNGIEATRQIVSESRNVKVVGLSMNADRRSVLAMLEAGAAGYLLKNAAAEDLIRALRAVVAGQTYLGPEIAGIVVEAMAQSPQGDWRQSPLSAREREVLQLLAEGRTSKQIAAKLHVAVSTVETHRRQIMSKLKIRTIAELTKYAVREGITSLDN